MGDNQLHITDILACLAGRNIPYTYDGDMTFSVTGTNTLKSATSDDMAWFGDIKYMSDAQNTNASLVITTQKYASHVSKNSCVLRTKNPRLAYAILKQSLYPVLSPRAYIDKTAHIAADAHIGKNVYIGAYAIIESGVTLQSGVRIGAYTVIGKNVKIGQHTCINTHCHIQDTIIGSDCCIAPHCTIGTDGFGFVLDFKNGHHSIPHTGGVRIGNGVIIGANACIDKGVEGNTSIGDGTRIDNLVHIAHNITIGRNCVIPAQVGMAGSVTVGDGVMFSGQAGVSDGVHIDDGAIVLMRAVVARNVGKNQVVSGTPSRPHKENLKREAKINQLLKDK